MRREKIFGLLILAMMLMFQTSLMAQNKREFRGAWIQCVNGQYLSLYTHLRAHETGRKLVCRLLLEKKKKA